MHMHANDLNILVAPINLCALKACQLLSMSVNTEILCQKLSFEMLPLVAQTFIMKE